MCSSVWSKVVVRFVTAAAVLSVLTGCGKAPPGCADGQTLSLVRETFWTAVAKRAADPAEQALLATVKLKFDVALLSPRVTEKRADAGKAFCAGTLKVLLTDEASKTVDKLFKRGAEMDVEYSSQITADGKEHFVELAGHQPAVEYVWSLAQMGAFRPAHAAPASAPVASAVMAIEVNPRASAAASATASDQDAPQPGASTPRTGG